jgi:hypothetical protein
VFAERRERIVRIVEALLEAGDRLLDLATCG